MSNQLRESPEIQNSDKTLHPFPSFSTLCLNPTANAAVDDPQLCSSCAHRHPPSASTPMKRRLPTTATKNLFLDHQHPNSIPFSKIDLPIPFNPSVSPLRRSSSDPTESLNFSSSPPLVQSPAKKLCFNSPLPPLPLRRTISDPIPSTGQTSDSPIEIFKDSPESKRLRRIKDRLKEMNKWWNEVMSEEEHDEIHTKKEKEEEDEEEETVGVERIGDSLALHLKCTCGKGFEILLSGRNCFYKLV